MFQIILEAVFVGVYTCLVFMLVNLLGKHLNFNKTSNNIELCLTGFLKHMLAFFLGLHTYYCNKGYACRPTIKGNKWEWESISDNLFGESVLEAIAFLIVGNLLIIIFKSKPASKLAIYFCIGFLLHLGAEIVYLHKWFCLHKCVKNIL